MTIDIHRRAIAHLRRKTELRSLPDFEDTQWWPYAQLLAFQEHRLQHIVTHAYNKIPGYRRKYQEVGVHPSDVKSIRDLAKVPIVTREELQSDKSFVDLAAINTTLFTGGSTGQPLEYFESHLATAVRQKAHLRGWNWNGYKPGERLAIVASAQGVVADRNVLNLMGSMTEDELADTARQIQAFEPRYLRGYVSSLFILAQYALEHGIRFESVVSINVISENLYDFQRKIIEMGFGCPVFEEYVCNDGGACAWECSCHNGLHYCMERAIIEEVDGAMIVTDLWNKAMPFIRYKNGDDVTFLNHKCSCGRQLPLIAVKGRTNDIIVTPHGPVSPTYPVQFVYGIRAVQFVQLPNYELQANIVKSTSCTNEELEHFRSKVERLCPGMTINLRIVQELPKTQKGKRSFVINRMNDYQVPL
jgi:phenylacetate-CoA ligase